MKKSFKNILSVLIILLLIARPISASVNDKPQDEFKLREANQIAVNYIQELIEKKTIPETQVDKVQSISSKVRNGKYLVTSDYFGGVFIDKDQTVNINVTHYDSINALKKSLSKEGSTVDTYINVVKYTTSELEKAAASLVEEGVLLVKGIEGVYTNIVDNNVSVLVYNDFDELSYNDLLESLNLDKNLVRIEYTKIEDAPEFKAYIGSAIRNTPGGNNNCSIGFPATRGGVKGFVTAAHCGNIGQRFYTPAGRELGKVSQLSWGGKADASWSPYSGSENIPKAFIHYGKYYNYTQASSSGLVVGQYVYNYTFNSPNTKAHEIVSLSYSSTVGGINLNDFIRVKALNGSIIGGDSGGGVSASTTSGDLKLIGITSFAGGSYGGIVKVNNIFSALGVSH